MERKKSTRQEREMLQTYGDITCYQRGSWAVLVIFYHGHGSVHSVELVITKEMDNIDVATMER